MSLRTENIKLRPEKSLGDFTGYLGILAQSALKLQKLPRNQKWWYTPVVPALGKLTKEDGAFKASLGCTGCLRLASAT
jgi:hypothetical protein